jgi:hypothetical protein
MGSSSLTAGTETREVGILPFSAPMFRFSCKTLRFVKPPFTRISPEVVMENVCSLQESVCLFLVLY